MKTFTRSFAGAAVLGLAAFALSGCVIAPARPYYYGGGGPVEPVYDDAVVGIAPPAPRYEVQGVAPVAGYIWIGGFWNWVGGRHVWIGGRWAAPRPGYRWAPHRWERAGHGWRQHPGHWEH